MELKELIQKAKEIIPHDDELRAYLYKDKIYFYDFSFGFDLPGYDTDEIVHEEDSMSCVVQLNLENNKIRTIENPMGNFITQANKDILLFFIELMDKEIEDYDKYDKLDDLYELPYLK